MALNWTAKTDYMTYEVVVWSLTEQRVTDTLQAHSFAIGRQMVDQIKREDPDLTAWVKSKRTKRPA